MEEIKSLTTEGSTFGGSTIEDLRMLVHLLLDSESVEYDIRENAGGTVTFIFGDQPESDKPGYIVRDDLIDDLKARGIRKWTGAIGYRKQNVPSWSVDTKRRSGETRWTHELTIHPTN